MDGLIEQLKSVTVQNTSETRNFSGQQVFQFRPESGLWEPYNILYSYFALWLTFTCLILDCGGMVKVTSDIEIKSEGYPTRIYPKNHLCSWFYYSDQKFNVSIDVKMSVTSCTASKVEIHQGTDQNATFTICGNTLVSPMRNLNRLLIVMKAGDVVMTMAFRAYFSLNCHNPETTVVKPTVIKTVESTPIVSTKPSSGDSTLDKTTFIYQGSSLVI